MANIVEVPLRAKTGKQIGIVYVDPDGRMRIEMKDWASASDIRSILMDVRAFVYGIADHTFSHMDAGNRKKESKNQT